jgi:hypothetical protein
MVHAILGGYANAKAERALSHAHEPSEATTKMKNEARHVLAGVGSGAHRLRERARGVLRVIVVERELPCCGLRRHERAFSAGAG